LQSFVREGDTEFCHLMDRPALNLDDLRRLVLGLTERGVNIVFVKENLTFAGEDSPMSGAFAEFELEGPRCGGKVEHLLIDILVIAGAESWVDMAFYG
jgi:DNA invertase Pin-like site-specific DNA recombinase